MVHGESNGAAAQSRTGTPFYEQGILSPPCLPFHHGGITQLLEWRLRARSARAAVALLWPAAPLAGQPLRVHRLPDRLLAPEESGDAVSFRQGYRSSVCSGVGRVAGAAHRRSSVGTT